MEEATVTLTLDEYKNLIDTLAQYERQVNDLQERNTELVEENRELKGRKVEQ
jgi:regulator of replication initiation timing